MLNQTGFNSFSNLFPVHLHPFKIEIVNNLTVGIQQVLRFEFGKFRIFEMCTVLSLKTEVKSLIVCHLPKLCF